MTRPHFLSSPGLWMRASRVDQTPADYACAVEIHQRGVSWWRVAACIAACVAIGAMLALGSR